MGDIELYYNICYFSNNVMAVLFPELNLFTSCQKRIELTV